MVSDKYKIAKELTDKIESTEYKIRHIDKLLGSCGLGCKIGGTPKNTFQRLGDYSSYNKEFIKNLLEDDKKKLNTELEILKKQFNEL